MKYGFNTFQAKVDDHVFWVAKSNSLKGCVGQGDTLEEAIKELEENEKEWLETAEEYDIPIPAVDIEPLQTSYSGKISLRLSKSVHEMAVERAKAEGISLNQYIGNCVNAFNVLETTKEVILAKVSYISKHETRSYVFDARLVGVEVNPSVSYA